MQSELIAKIFGDKEDPRLRLENIFGGPSDLLGPSPAAREWAKSVLHIAGIDPADAHTSAVKCLRVAQPCLTLKAAAYLSNHAAQR